MEDTDDTQHDEFDEVDDGDEENINTSLNDVLDLLLGEIDRLKAELELLRLSANPDKDLLVRECIANIDKRQDAAEEVKAMLMAGGDTLH